ncbi:MAG: hypothetical protein HOV81_29140, partial [Kofleriaceae bacterium]|nr:hypothetical protein [Kofleriaceae bacterium]
MRKIIDLYSMPVEVMLVLEHPSGVYYENQVGGLVCARAELEGVLVPFDLHTDGEQQIMNLP